MYLSLPFPGCTGGKESACEAGDTGLIPGLERYLGDRTWQPDPVTLPGEFHGRETWWATVHGVVKSQT